jgi:hypothetical protein
VKTVDLPSCDHDLVGGEPRLGGPPTGFVRSLAVRPSAVLGGPPASGPLGHRSPAPLTPG